jgi:hypothetical protein
MLKTISYVNIAFALVYTVLYLLNSYSLLMLGLVLLVIYNGFIISAVEKRTKMSAWYAVLGIPFLVLAVFLMVWGLNILKSSISYNYFGNSWLYVLLTLPFAISIIWQLFLILKRVRSNLRP